MTNKNTKNKMGFAIVGFLTIILIVMVVTTVKQNELASVMEESISVQSDLQFDLENDLSIVKVGSYSGAYMEDASHEEVTDVMMIMVTNNGNKVLQYAEIILSSETEKAVFKLSTLSPSQSVMVLEAERKTYNASDNYTEASAQYVAFFEDEINTYDEILKIQPLEGGFNITNLSEEDIMGEIIVYFKDYEDGILLGGITYRGRIRNGLKAGEIKQIMSSNFTEKNSKVMFVTIAGK